MIPRGCEKVMTNGELSWNSRASKNERGSADFEIERERTV